MPIRSYNVGTTTWAFSLRHHNSIEYEALAMSRSGQLSISRTKNIKRPNEYILALGGEFSEWTFDEEQAPTCKGRWREILGLGPNEAVDVELGTGNGYHFAHQALHSPDRGLVGF